MMIKVRNALLAGLVFCLPATSQAVDMYAFARGGMASTQITNTDATNPILVFGDPGYPSVTQNGSLGIVKENNSDDVSTAALGLGFILNKHFRLELEGSLQRESDFQVDLQIGGDQFGSGITQPLGTGFNKISVESEIFLLKAYFDIPINETVAPYFMAGIGYARNKASGVQTFSANANWNEKWDDTTSSDTAWTIGIGLSYQFDQNLTFDLGLEHRNLGNWELDNLPATGDESFKGDLESTTLLFGVRYLFH